MAREKYDVQAVLKQGEKFAWSATIADDGVNWDLTGWTGRFRVYDERGGKQCIDVDDVESIAIGADEEWHVKLDVSDSETQNVVSPDGCREFEPVGQLDLIDVSGEVCLRLDFQFVGLADIGT